MDSQITICTIISKNYLAHARVLTESFLKNNPDGKVYVLLVDRTDEKFDPAKEKFILVNIDEIGIKNLKSFCFKYDILEQNTGAKANFLKYLFEKHNLKKIAYFDPDILFTNSLENLWNLLNKKSIVLTPHITSPITDDKHPSEIDILRSGSYNLGFIALSNNETSHKFLDWWILHLMEHGFNDIEKGFFTDQKWIDLVPSVFDDVYIIRHLGYNVAYWNIGQRNISISENNTVSVDKKPMYFFHFNGFSPEKTENISKHQNRFLLKDVESFRPLFELYRDLLIENDYLNTKNWKCKFNYFDNGVKIPKFARKIYASLSNKEKKYKNPFSTSESDSFINFLNKNIDDKQPVVTRLWYEIYKDRKDAKEIFSEPLQKNRKSFVKWIEYSLTKEYDFDREFLPSSILSKSELISLDKPGFDLIVKRKLSEKERIDKLNFDKIGINVSGFLKGEFGVGESSRNYVLALKDAKIPFVLNNIISNAHRNADETLTEFKKNNPFPINLVIVNADQSEIFLNQTQTEYFKNKYNIGIWAWELSEFPEKLRESQKWYDEIWVLSNFVAESLSKALSIPVVKISSPIHLDETKLVQNKKKFGLNEKDFVFLFNFDFHSIMERKNPKGLVKAFSEEFKDEDNVVLVIKSINGSKFASEYNELKDLCKDQKIKLIDEHYDKNDLLSLIGSCDCYVSLHRSEGFGLTIAEAMFAKKPVIATSYGGNTDFMNINNSFPVKYNLEKLEKDYGPYKKGNLWAEPDIEHAKFLMRFIFKNKKESEIIANNAHEFIKDKLSPKEIGKEIFDRINTLSTKS